MIGKSIQLDEKTVSNMDLGCPVPVIIEEESNARTGVTVADLIHAAGNGFAMIVRYVLMAGVNPNETDATGRTAFMVAANQEIREILREAMAKTTEGEWHAA